MGTDYRICTQCIMDTSVPDIRFDENGVCNYCRLYEERIRNELHYDEDGQKKLQDIVGQMKSSGKGKDYDCVIGVSGGVDSTYVAYIAKKILGLRPLAVHLDNGWDSELAVNNIEYTLKRLEIDLFTHVLNWEEFRDLQVSFLKSSVSNAEIPTDHAIAAILFRMAAEHGIKFIISGSNLMTEAIMPKSWMYNYMDLRFLKALHRRFGTKGQNNYPTLNLVRFAWYTMVKGIKFFPILNYVRYDREEAKRLLTEEIGWRDYGGKHYESIYTRFFQGYILPEKFRMDKRRPHYSTMILSGLMTREQALEEMEKELYTPEQLEQEREFVVKKLNLTPQEFDDIMNSPPKSFDEYPNNAYLWRSFAPIVRFAKRRATMKEKVAEEW